MFKHGVMGVFLCLVLAGCGSDEGTQQTTSSEAQTASAEVPASQPSVETYSYSIVKDTQKRDIERTVEVVLSERITEQQLTALAQKLKNSDPKEYKNTYFLFFTQDKPNSSWANVTFTPDMKVQIFGTTKEEDEKIVQIKPTIKGELVGRWQSSFYGKDLSCQVLIEKVGKKTIMREIYNDGNEREQELLTRKKEGQTIYMTEAGEGHGEYYLINEQGNLEFWSENGNYYTANKL